jgi:hypothetical protein
LLLSSCIHNYQILKAKINIHQQKSNKTNYGIFVESYTNYITIKKSTHDHGNMNDSQYYAEQTKPEEATGCL